MTFEDIEAAIGTEAVHRIQEAVQFACFEGERRQSPNTMEAVVELLIAMLASALITSADDVNERTTAAAARLREVVQEALRHGTSPSCRNH